jgi:hypothetical protein
MGGQEGPIEISSGNESDADDEVMSLDSDQSQDDSDEDLAELLEAKSVEDHKLSNLTQSYNSIPSQHHPQPPLQSAQLTAFNDHREPDGNNMIRKSKRLQT